MEYRKILLSVAVLCCMAAIGPAARSQDGTLLNFKQYRGRDGAISYIPPGKIIDARMDSAGNTYVFGMMGYEARLDGRFICKGDSLYGISIQSGYFLAKMDTTGAIRWIRATRGLTGGSNTSQFMSMAMRNGRIYIAQNEDCNLGGSYYAWYYFIDTVYWVDIPYPPTEAIMDSLHGEFPFETRNSGYTRILVFDTAGQLLEHHRVDILHYVDLDINRNKPVVSSLYSGLMDVDNRGNVYLFFNMNTQFASAEWDSVHTARFRIYDKDTVREFPLGFEDINSSWKEQIGSAVMVRIDPSWTSAVCRPLIRNVSNWSLTPLYDSIWLESYQSWYKPVGMPVEIDFKGISIDEDGNIYLNGNLMAGLGVKIDVRPNDTASLMLDVHPPCYFYFDSVHYLVAENYYVLDRLPFAMKLDSAGNTLWVNQLYSQRNPNPHSDEPFGVFTQSHTLDSNHLYMRLNPNLLPDHRPILFFFDSTHLDTIRMTQKYLGNAFVDCALHCLVFNKLTGEGVTHYQMDTCVRGSSERVPVNVIGGKISTAETKTEPVYVDPTWAGLQAVHYDMGAGSTTLSPMTYFDAFDNSIKANMLQHPHGFQFWYGLKGNDGEMRLAGADTTVFLQKWAAFMMLYYDSAADCRRPHADTTRPDTTAAHHPRLSPHGPLFAVTPNPSTGRATATMRGGDLSEKRLIVVHNAAGHEVLRLPVAPGSESALLDLEGCPPGTYFVTLSSATASATQRLVLE